MRSTFWPSISPFPSPVDSVFTRSQSAWVSKSLVKSSRRGSVVAGSPARTAAMIRRYFKGLLRFGNVGSIQRSQVRHEREDVQVRVSAADDSVLAVDLVQKEHV